MGGQFGRRRLGLVRDGLKTGEDVGNLFRSAGGRKDRLVVTLHDAKPMIDIGGKNVARLRGRPKIASEIGSADLSRQLFRRIDIITDALTEFPRHAALGACPVGQLVRENRVPALGGCACVGASEAEAVGHGDRFFDMAIEGAVTALSIFRSDCPDEGIRRRDRVDRSADWSISSRS
ncbi:hypothetical protein [Fluviibacterium sp. S390]|uniref:hypothetical protein n=1 Tax=Fluviibacterium sp. S390 TaxID=3415139 RepID=UPI003C7E2EA6